MPHYSVLEVFTDGGSRGNPGPGASSFIAYKDNSKLYEHSYFLKNTTNNIAEYFALLMAVYWLTKNVDLKNISKCTFHLDSELVVKQMTGEYKIKNQKLKEIAIEIKKLLPLFGDNYNFVHINREKNVEADLLVNKEIDENI
ncbi:MAG: Ribonuclease H [Candidatus Woesebacteria bacterium GW2011_GWB1_38_5]|uniref:Ribonuclease H n=4 Tax=Candidatus Woeseibacteriota TaxID=1752722 RepID=A0A0G0L9X7_9BACT|nr:MAG: Ribonuclease H [Candidatus Woesebacteria bacterium GW2011_GWD1_38_10]KKQ55440.1 MAG: ribonuclease HI, ribonuclease HI [Candidatus Woesebacteria bacterium GW2011_GWC1_38_13]KKQ74249.1 MAG: Ribonuclease H [Candidatus Woesebacteria bacterium GW2011_GWB1_38_5]KKQ84645.1 MAG: Ribonuclease H [Candidatus Woesebacteria bacterium GW2011_GWA1_38_8]